MQSLHKRTVCADNEDDVKDESDDGGGEDKSQSPNGDNDRPRLARTHLAN